MFRAASTHSSGSCLPGAPGSAWRRIPARGGRKDEQGRNELGADGRPTSRRSRICPPASGFCRRRHHGARVCARSARDGRHDRQDGFPIGGNAVVIFNARAPRAGRAAASRTVGFVDGGNVFKHVGDLDLGELRAAVGVRRAIPVAGRADPGRHRLQGAPRGSRRAGRADRASHQPRAGVLNDGEEQKAKGRRQKTNGQRPRATRWASRSGN